MDKLLKYKLDYLLIILLSFPVLFLKLGSFSLRLWDESVYALNSIEMMEKGSWLVPYYNGEIDAWNTKPPMIHWLQIISMKIFGINEFAVRFPSALAALGTVLLVYWFLKKHFNSFTGMIGSLVLLTSVGFISFHGARTGDTDAVLTFFITMVNLLALDLFLSRGISNKKVVLLFIALSFGFLTKSIAVLLFLPFILIFGFLFEKRITLDLFKNKITWLAVIGFLIISAGFILLRNKFQPGYLDLVLSSDVGRVGTTIEKHNEPFSFYLDNLVNYRYSYWIILFIGSFVLLFVSADSDKRKKTLQFVTFISLFYLLLISISVTKLTWYDIPLFPIMAVNIALLFGFIMEQIKLSVIKSALMLFAIFIIPYKHVFGLSQTNHYSEFERQNEVKERYLKEKINRGFSYPVAHAKKVIIYHEGYRRALDFYQKTAEPDLMMNIFITGHPDFTAGDEVWISQDGLKKIFEEKYEFEIIETFENLNVYKVITPTN